MFHEAGDDCTCLSLPQIYLLDVQGVGVGVFLHVDDLAHLEQKARDVDGGVRLGFPGSWLFYCTLAFLGLWFSTWNSQSYRILCCDHSLEVILVHI